METCLTRLYMDGALRRLLVLEPAAVLDRYDLTDAEREAISRIAPTDIERLARTLRLKRQWMIAASYPRLNALHDATVERLTQRYFESTVLEAGVLPEYDALRYGRFIEASLRERRPHQPGLEPAIDAVTYERARLRVHCTVQAEPPVDPERPCIVGHAEVLRLSRRLEPEGGAAENKGEDGPPGSEYVLIVIGRPDESPLEFESDETTARLLERCDGVTTIDQIAAREVADGHADDPDDVRGALQALRESGLIS